MLLDYQFLAEKMWFKERDNRKLDISYSGYTGILKNNPTISLRLNNWVHDKRWLTTPKKESEDTVSLNIENISLEYEKDYICNIGSCRAFLIFLQLQFLGQTSVDKIRRSELLA